MEHVVFYPAATGVPAFRRVSSLDEAVNFVEHLRNVENITDFSVQALTPVQLSFRAYYHAQVPVDAPVETSEPDVAVETAAADEPTEAVAEEVSGTEAPEPTAEVSLAPVLVAVAAEPVEQPEVATAEVTEVADDAAEGSEANEANEASADDSDAPAEESAPVLVAVAEDIETPEVVAETPAPAASEPVAVSADVEDASEAVTLAPVEADDDRSAEWVAEAVVLEPAAEAPSVEASAVPGLVADEPAVKPVLAAVEPIAESEAEPVAEAVAEDETAPETAVVEAPAQRTPFADAPPVSAPVAPVEATDAEVDPALDPANGDVIPALAPSGRRSLGFFAR
jgi:hypothetical protein